MQRSRLQPLGDLVFVHLVALLVGHLDLGAELLERVGERLDVVLDVRGLGALDRRRVLRHLAHACESARDAP